MKTLVLLALVGLGAQLVDGSLGMAYGVTSTTLLLAIGTNPAVGLGHRPPRRDRHTLASGLSHWKFGNVDWKVVAEGRRPRRGRRLRRGDVAVPPLHRGRRAGDVADPACRWASTCWSASRLRGIDRRNLGKPMRKRFLAPLGLVAGFVDATGGGGWGPVGTPALLASGRMEPRKVIGSIDTSEFLVALAASLGFLFALGSQGIDFVLGRRPAGRRAGRRADRRLAGPAHPAADARLVVGGVIVLTNTRTLLTSDWIDARRPGALHRLRGALRGLGRRRRPLLPPVPQGPRRWSPPRRSPPRPRSRRTWSRRPSTPRRAGPPAVRASRPGGSVH